MGRTDIFILLSLMTVLCAQLIEAHSHCLKENTISVAMIALAQHGSSVTIATNVSVETNMAKLLCVM